MILVLLGTQNNNFNRLLEEVDNCLIKGIISDEVIVQAGHTKYQSNKMKILDFIPVEDFDNLLQQSNIIITHGGVGSIITALNLNKKVIAVPRLKKYGEHVNDHQLQIVEAFDKLGYLKAVFNITDLPIEVKNINHFTPRKFVSNNQNFLKIITNYIDNN